MSSHLIAIKARLILQSMVADDDDGSGGGGIVNHRLMATDINLPAIKIDDGKSVIRSVVET